MRHTSISPTSWLSRRRPTCTQEEEEEEEEEDKRTKRTFSLAPNITLAFPPKEEGKKDLKAIDWLRREISFICN